ncbi:Uncharacterized protein HZ326_4381 [Fusarium oxysporum f. sp. albedinis]|nr:Uncharacterized protein HZ326_4381 [Fusarium oxysporum f. sp. albedinis]
MKSNTATLPRTLDENPPSSTFVPRDPVISLAVDKRGIGEGRNRQQFTGIRGHSRSPDVSQKAPRRNTTST